MMYDRWYNMSLVDVMRRLGIYDCKCWYCTAMREPGVEPGCPKAADPKSPRCPLSEGATEGTGAAAVHGNGTDGHPEYDQKCDMGYEVAVGSAPERPEAAA